MNQANKLQEESHYKLWFEAKKLDKKTKNKLNRTTIPWTTANDIIKLNNIEK